MQAVWINSNEKTRFLSVFIGLCDSEDHSSGFLTISIRLFIMCACMCLCVHLCAYLWLTCVGQKITLVGPQGLVLIFGWRQDLALAWTCHHKGRVSRPRSSQASARPSPTEAPLGLQAHTSIPVLFWVAMGSGILAHLLILVRKYLQAESSPQLHSGL